MIFQGFVDLHVHGTGRYSTRSAKAEDILKIADSLARSGTAAFLPTIYSGSPGDMRAGMKAVAEAMELQKASILPTARILGIHLEGPFLSPLRCGAQNRATFLKPAVPTLKSLIAGYESLVKIITLAPELPGALKVIEKCAEQGIRINMGHSDATWSRARDAKKAGARGVSHIFNAMRPFHHRDPGLIGFSLLDEDIYVEVIADGIHLHKATLELIFGIKRLDRIILVSDSVARERSRGRRNILRGSTFSLAKAAAILQDIHVPDGEIIEAGRENPCRYLGIDLD